MRRATGRAVDRSISRYIKFIHVRAIHCKTGTGTFLTPTVHTYVMLVGHALGCRFVHFGKNKLRLGWPMPV